jgi:hypothetical protein
LSDRDVTILSLGWSEFGPELAAMEAGEEATRGVSHDLKLVG